MLTARRLPAVLAACLTLALFATGCSKDIHVFRSTELSPKNVAIVSAVSGETLWSINVPEGQQLRLDFDRPGGNEVYRSPDVPATSVKWELWSLDAIPAYGQKMKGGKKLDRGDKVDLPEEQTLIQVQVRDNADGLSG